MIYKGSEKSPIKTLEKTTLNTINSAKLKTPLIIYYKVKTAILSIFETEL